jgi:hypothetical protein
VALAMGLTLAAIVVPLVAFETARRERPRILP